MKTERLTLLINPADKAEINARAEQLGISVSELVRRAALGYDPDEDAARAELEALLPEFNDAVERILATFDRMIAKSEAAEQRWAYYDSDEYREQVREQVWADPNIDWDWIAKLRAGALHREPRAA